MHASAALPPICKLTEVVGIATLLQAEAMLAVARPLALVAVGRQLVGGALLHRIVEQDTETVAMVLVPLADVDRIVTPKEDAKPVFFVVRPLASVLLEGGMGILGVAVGAVAVALLGAFHIRRGTALVGVAICKADQARRLQLLFKSLGC
jgi:hypothetical protein